MSETYIVPQGKNSESFVELSQTSRTPKAKGKLFKKHILSEGKLHYRGKTVDIDSDFMSSLVKNFDEKKCDIVQVPLAGDKNEHSEAPDRNLGEVVGLTIEDGKLYSYIDARKHAEDFGNTLIGASAMIHPNYTDTSTDTTVGPTLLHVAVTNRPHVLNLEDYEEVIAASSQSGDEVILLSEDSESESTNNTEENTSMNLEQILAELKEKHGIDVVALQEAEKAKDADLEALNAEKDKLVEEANAAEEEKAKQEELAVKLSNAIKENLEKSGVIKLSNDGSADDAIEAIVEAGIKLSAQSEEIVSLSGRVEGLETAATRAKAEKVVDEHISAGKIYPVQRDAMIELRLSNEAIFDKIIPDTPIIELSVESGVDTETFDTSDKVQSEVDRLKGIK